MLWNRKNRSQPRAVPPVEQAIIQVSQELMDKAFDRSAGRYCGHCDRFGSHHTEQHNDFARAALARG